MKKHPKLAKKFLLLYKLRLNPSLRSNADLAKELGITRQSISRWSTGTETFIGDCIPHGKLEIVSNLFYIEPSYWLLPLDEFSGKITERSIELEKERSTRPQKISTSLLPQPSMEVFGREEETDFLTRGWEDENVNLIDIVGFGGMGKSSLVHHWLGIMAADKYKGAKKIYAWSFHWQSSSNDSQSSGDYFVEHALGWFGDPKPQEGSPWDKATRLVNRIRETRTLLILDGLEPLQCPPGPKAGRVENPAVELLLKELAANNNGLCVVTSRISVFDVDGFRDGRAMALALDKLNSDAGVQLLKRAGLTGTNDEFFAAVDEYSGHPLSLTLLGGYISVVHSGQIAQFRRLGSLLNERNQADQVKTLMSAYFSWLGGSKEGALLCLVGLFDRAAELKDLKSIVSVNNIPELTDSLGNISVADWGYALDKLVQAKLITVERGDCAVLVDCHPLVRDFIEDYMESSYKEAWEQTHGEIFDLLCCRAEKKPVTIADLDSLFRAVIHGARAGRYDEAFKVYFERIRKRQVSLFVEGSHHADQACIREFFESEWGKLKQGVSESDGYYLKSCVATNLIYLGEIDSAIDPSMNCIEWFVDEGKVVDALNSTGPLASMLIAAGRVGDSDKLISNMRGSIEMTKSSLVEAMGENFHAYGHFLRGDYEKAKYLFEKLDQVIVQESPVSDVLIPTISAYYCKFLLETGQTMAALDRALKTMEWRENKAWQVAVDTTSLLASDLMMLGLIYLKLGDLDKARAYLDEQVDLLRSVGDWLYLPTGLNSRALYSLEVKDFDVAQEQLSEAMSIAKRTGAKFSEWEACLDLAQLYLRRNERPISKFYLEKALSIPSMNEYKFRDLEIAEIVAMLKDVKPENPSFVEPVPQSESRNRA